MDLSIIIVNYNVRHFLEQCLNSVFRALEGVDGEVIVVDNNSADGSCSMLRDKYPAARLIENRYNAGFSAANNQAIEIASGTFILFLNPDTVIPENALKRCIEFMENNPNAGAIGLKMIDGRGRYLPESKRGLPTPTTSFFRISGLYKLFPRSGFINKYYHGDLDADLINEVDILTGAFMFMRHTVLKITGGFDESYFMYGEDIDLSYSITKAGYKNYYLPDPPIIHFKGESTKKMEISTTLHFYRSMIIFAKKYFGKSSGWLLILLIRAAVSIRGAISLIYKVIERIITPFTEALLVYFIVTLVSRTWGQIRFENPDYYPGLFTGFILPLYSVIWVIGLYLLGAYRKSCSIWSIIKGVSIGTLIILAGYAVLPVDLRFSRAVILLGSVAIAFSAYIFRFTLAWSGLKIYNGIRTRTKRIVVAASYKEYKRIVEIISGSRSRSIVIGRVSVLTIDKHPHLGNIENIREVVRINQPDEIIFSSSDISATVIIESIKELSGFRIEKKIAQTDSEYVIGSKSPFHRGEVYTLELSEKK
jgi:GT2 family glycosyltransferase